MNDRERPIIFTGPMVCAIREHRKTQTRRVIKGQFCFGAEGRILNSNGLREKKCPYGQPGDRLWVRETWRLSPSYDSYPPSKLSANCGPVWYAATPDRSREATEGGRLRASFHLPRWASRLTLEILKIRVERVQEITQVDIAAEGIQIPVQKVGDPPVWGILRVTGKYPPSDYFPEGYKFGDSEPNIEVRTTLWLKAHFASLWDSINAKRGFGWDANPWVYVIDFKVVGK